MGVNIPNLFHLNMVDNSHSCGVIIGIKITQKNNKRTIKMILQLSFLSFFEKEHMIYQII